MAVADPRNSGTLLQVTRKLANERCSRCCPAAVRQDRNRIHSESQLIRFYNFARLSGRPRVVATRKLDAPHTAGLPYALLSR